MARSLSANGQYKEALRCAKLALARAPDEINRKGLTDGIAQLEQGRDVNQQADAGVALSGPRRAE